MKRNRQPTTRLCNAFDALLDATAVIDAAWALVKTHTMSSSWPLEEVLKDVDRIPARAEALAKAASNYATALRARKIKKSR